eukprot:892258-Alexandrium_andersonii.AAC.1
MDLLFVACSGPLSRELALFLWVGISTRSPDPLAKLSELALNPVRGGAAPACPLGQPRLGTSESRSPP